MRLGTFFQSIGSKAVEARHGDDVKHECQCVLLVAEAIIILVHPSGFGQKHKHAAEAKALQQQESHRFARFQNRTVTAEHTAPKGLAWCSLRRIAGQKAPHAHQQSQTINQ